MSNLYVLGNREVPIHVAKLEWIEEAKEAAIQRRKFHSSYGSKRHWHDEKKGEYLDEIYGTLGEIVYREKMRELGLIENSKFPLLFTTDLSSLPDWDAMIFDKTVDVKAVPPDSDGVKRCRLLIKLSEFKNMDYYIAVKFHDISHYSFCGYETGENIVRFPIGNFGYTESYWCFLKDLKRVTTNWYEN